MTRTVSAPPRPRSVIAARVLTEAFAPAPVGIVALGTVAWRFSPTVGDAVKWIGLSVLFVVLLPFAYLLWRVRRGAVTDIHVRRREQRLSIILVFLGSWLVLIALLVILGAPHELIALIIAGITALVVMGAITLRWKISLHVGVASGVLTIFILLFGPWILPLAALVPLLGWARAEMGDHTYLQVSAGAIIGAIVSGSAFELAMAALGALSR